MSDDFIRGRAEASADAERAAVSVSQKHRLKVGEHGYHGFAYSWARYRLELRFDPPDTGPTARVRAERRLIAEWVDAELGITERDLKATGKPLPANVVDLDEARHAKAAARAHR